MPFYPVMPPDVTLGCPEDAAAGLLGQAGMIAVRVADVASSAQQGLGKDGRTALTAAGAGRIRSGDLERLRDLALAGVDGEHRSRDYRAVTVGDLEAGSALMESRLRW